MKSTNRQNNHLPFWRAQLGLILCILLGARAIAAGSPFADGLGGRTEAVVTGCDAISVQGGAGSISIQGMSAPLIAIQVFNSSWVKVFDCSGNCSAPNQLIPSLPAGTYFVKIDLLNSNWTPICAKEAYVTVLAGSSCSNVTSGGTIAGDQTLCPNADPAAITSSALPSGGSGQLEYMWLSSTTGCPQTNSAAVAGAYSESYDPGPVAQTTWFVRCARRAGCTDWTVGESNCVKITVDANANCGGGGQPDCNLVSISGGAGTITITNLTAPIVSVQVFNSSWSQVFNCSGNCQSPQQVVSSLLPGQYYVKTNFYTAQWQPICVKEAYVTVTNGTPPPPQTPSISVNDLTVAENAGNAVLTVSLSAASTGPVTVNYSTQNGVAVSGGDYQPVSGTLTIPAGATSAFITIPIVDDAVNEPTEAFTLNLSGTTGATIAKPTGNVTITDNDTAPGGGQPDCNLVSISATGSSIAISGLNAPIIMVQAYNSGWASVFNQTYTTSPGTVSMPGLSAGTYFVKVDFLTAQWASICKKEVYVTVVGGGQTAPVANNDNASTSANTAVTISPLTNDNLNGGSVQSIQITQNPLNGTVSLNGTNFVYTPNAGFSGTDVFTYRINASNGQSNTATVTVNVQNNCGSIAFTSGVGQAQGSNIAISAACGATSGTATWTAPSVTITGATGGGCGTPGLTSNFQPGASFPLGTSTVTYTATYNGQTITRSFTVTVTAAAANAASKLLSFSFNSCSAGSSYAEFVPQAFGVAGFTAISGSVLRHNGGLDHSCNNGPSSIAFCTNGSSSTTPNYGKAIAFDLNLTGTNGSLTGVSFYQRSTHPATFSSGSSKNNNRLRKFAVRVKNANNGSVLFEQTDIAATTAWNKVTITFPTAIAVSGTQKYTVELVGYDPVSTYSNYEYIYDIDDLEVQAQGCGTVPAIGCQPKILFLCNGLSLNASDNLIKQKLELLGYIVDCVLDAGSGLGSINGHGCVVVSPSCNDANLGWLKSLILPVVSFKASLLVNLGMASTHGLNSYWSWDNDHCQIGSFGLWSWLFGGQTGFKKLFDFPFGTSNSVSWGRPNIGNCDFTTLVPWSTTDCRTFGYRKGKGMIGGFLAPHHRAAVCFGDNKAQYLNNDGWTHILNAVKWATECDNLDLTGGAGDRAAEFSATRDVDVVQLQWLNSTGELNSHFIVQRSADGVNFSEIARKDGQGPKDELLYFAETDAQPLEGINYYRLKLVLRDGSFRYSDVKTVEFPVINGVSVYPNPAQDRVFISFDKKVAEGASFELVNAFGKVVHIFRAEATERTFDFDLDGIENGIYFMHILVEGQRAVTQKVVVEHAR